MLKIVGSITILVAILMGDNISLGIPIAKPIKKVKKSVTKKVKKVVHHKFRKDDHRYDKRYRHFDYDRYGYFNDDGFYFGYFDRRGYFFNNIYFEYNPRFTYRDRLHRRGPFAPFAHHYRRYRHHRDNDWNRVHRYREPNIIVYGNYYNNVPAPAPARTPVYYNSVRDRNRVVPTRPSSSSRRDTAYVVSRPYREENINTTSTIPTTSSRYIREDNYRDNNYYNSSTSRNRDTGRVTYHRYSDEDYKDSYNHKSNGRLSVTK